MNFSSHCAPRLKEERKRLALSQIEAADKVGVSREMWGKYERGAAAPSSEILMLYAVTGADVQYILTGVRSSMALTPDESVLLEGYRSLDEKTRRRVLAFMLEEGQQTKQEQVFNAEVGQAIKIGGNLDQKGISFFKGHSKKK